MLHAAFQPSLLAAAPPGPLRFDRVRRIDVDPNAWVDHVAGWVDGADALFTELVDGLDWGQRRRRMYDRVVTEPRLTAGWSSSSTAELHPGVEAMRSALGARYGVVFDSVGFNLYRDGRDSVAWHRDRIDPALVDPVVALVSLGERRRFLLRPRGGGSSRRFMLGRGDLLVTGGTCQRTWEHAVPKVVAAGPRMSIAFRHSRPPA